MNKEKKRCSKCGVPMIEVWATSELAVVRKGISPTYGEKAPVSKVRIFECENCGFLEFYASNQ